MADADGVPGAERVEVTSLGRGQYRVSVDSRQRLAFAAGPADARWVFLGGRTYVIDGTGSGDRPPRRTRDDDMSLASPMPATVASIHASAGQEVAQGDLLVMLEAMKMELPIRSPRKGRVKAVTCAVGDLAQPGVPLVELD